MTTLRQDSTVDADRANGFHVLGILLGTPPRGPAPRDWVEALRRRWWDSAHTRHRSNG